MDVPFDQRLGLRLQRAEHGTAVYEGDAGPDWHNPTQRVHGGFIAGLADAAMGAAFLSSLPAGASGTNLDLSLRFLRPVDVGTLTATASTIKAGARVSFLSCDVTDADGRLVAVAQSQFIRLDPPGSRSDPPDSTA